MDNSSFSNARITQLGDHSVGQQSISFGASQQGALDALPDDAMAAFIRATAQSVAALQLSAAALEQAQQTLDEIRLEAAAGPEPKRLRGLALGLRRIVEEAAGNALGAAVLGLWHP